MSRKLTQVLGRRGALAAELLGIGAILVLVAASWWWLPPWPLRSWSLPDEPRDMMVSPNGQTLVLAHPFALSSWDTANGKQKAVLSFPPGPGDIQRGISLEGLSPGGDTVVFRDHGGQMLRLWNSTGDAAPISLPSEIPTVSSDGKVLVMRRVGLPGAEQGADQPMWDLTTGQARVSKVLETHAIFNIFPLNDGRLLGIEEIDTPNRTVWDITTGTKLLTVEDSKQLICSADGRRCVSSHPDSIKIWDLPTGKVISATDANPTIDKSGLGSLSPDGRLLVTWEKPDKKCVLWDIDSMPPRRIGVVSDANPYLHSFSPDGHWLAVCLPGDFADQWEIWETKPLRRHLRNLACATTGPALASDSRTIVCKKTSAVAPTLLDRFLNRNVDTAYAATLWDLQKGKEISTFPYCEDFVYLPDGKHIAISRPDKILELWEIPPRRTVWIEYGLPALFVLLLLLACWRSGRFQKHSVPANGVPVPPE